MRIRTKAIPFLFLLVTIQVYAYQITGKVIKVTDGDTITILDSQYQSHKIRFADIDAPESGQPFGKKSQQYLAQLVAGKNVVADCREKDRYQRNVCTVHVNDIDVNKELVQGGYAWVYTKYNKRDDLPYLQEQAKLAKIGLWGQPEASIINPENWRRGQRNLQAQISTARENHSGNAAFTCGSKRYCRQMSSCNEAMFYLRQCGLTRLDGDHDGIPCEKICGHN